MKWRVSMDYAHYTLWGHYLPRYYISVRRYPMPKRGDRLKHNFILAADPDKPILEIVEAFRAKVPGLRKKDLAEIERLANLGQEQLGGMTP